MPGMDCVICGAYAPWYSGRIGLLCGDHQRAWAEFLTGAVGAVQAHNAHRIPDDEFHQLVIEFKAAIPPIIDGDSRPVD